VKAKPTELVLRAGYPPAPIVHADKVRLSEAEIASGETIIVEIHEVEEPKIEQKAVIPKETKVEPIEKPKAEPIKTSSVVTQQKPSGPIIEEKPISQQPSKYPTSSKMVEEKPRGFEQPIQQPSKYNPDYRMVEEKPKMPEQKPRITNDNTRLVEEKLQAYSIKDKKPEIPTKSNETSSLNKKIEPQPYTSKPDPTSKYPTSNIQTKNTVLDKKYIVDEPHLKPSTKDLITKKTEIPTKQKDYRDPFYEIKNDNVSIIPLELVVIGVLERRF
jgi:hypothetical protein